MTTVFRNLLKQNELSQEDLDHLRGILAYINKLYTVYTNLFIYDKNLSILAVSNSAESNLIGETLSDDFAKKTLSICDSQRYSVSPFEATNLYAGKHSYIFNASITDLDRPNKVLGGIGIVFNSAPEFS